MTKEQEIHLMKHAEEDEIYQEILTIRNIYEQDFNRILLALSPEDQHCLNMYVKACQGAEARVSRTAYFLVPKL